MAQRRRVNRAASGLPALLLSPRVRVACVVANILPLPGLGAIVAGWRNPHTRLLRNGVFQMLLVVFGTWPLIVPGVVGFAWAIWDATRIGRARLQRLPPATGSNPDATPQKAKAR